MPFPILSEMTLNQLVKETVAKRERLVGGRTKGRGFLQPPLSEFYHQPPSSFSFPPDIYFCLFIATWESLCLPTPSGSPDHPGLQWQEKIMSFPLYVMNMPDEQDSQEYQLFKNITRLLDLRQRKWLEFSYLLKSWPFDKPASFRRQISLKESPASRVAQHLSPYSEWKRRQKLQLAEGRGKPTKKPTWHLSAWALLFWWHNTPCQFLACLFSGLPEVTTMPVTRNTEAINGNW